MEIVSYVPSHSSPNPHMIYTISKPSPNLYELQLTSPLLPRHSISAAHHHQLADGRVPHPWLHPLTGHGLRRTRSLLVMTSDRRGHKKPASPCASTSTSALNLGPEGTVVDSIRFCVTCCDCLEDRLGLRMSEIMGGRYSIEPTNKRMNDQKHIKWPRWKNERRKGRMY